MLVSFIVFNIKSTVSKSFISSTLKFIEKFSSLFWNVLQAWATTIFEILESEGIENYQEVISFINQIKSLGARIAIDDFGTGYSNFEHLLRLDVDYIKIDGSLIKNIVTDDKHRLIVETIVSFAKRIGIKTVAEFVSDEKILQTIKEIGISCAQGYHIGKPETLV